MSVARSMKTAPSTPTLFSNAVDNVQWTWTNSLVLYAVFAAIVFLVQGSQPVLGPDHITYFQLADSIIDAHPAGDYWREANSVRSFGVLLAYLHSWTASHILSMKLMLAGCTVLYLLSAELLFGLFTKERWQSVLFALVSGFAVSFGVASWGVTDSAALLPRTLVAPLIVLSIWFWLRFYDRLVKYLVFSFLVAGSVVHLSTFYVAGILCLLELWDFVAIRKLRVDVRIPAFLFGTVLAALLLYVFESLGISVKILGIHLPQLVADVGFPTLAARIASATASAPTQVFLVTGGVGHGAAQGALSASEAWAIELSLRPWRNMPLGLANVANMLSSCAVVLLLAFYGLAKARKAGFTSTDRVMAAMFVAIPVFALLPQTVLWVLRSFTDVYPVTIEEIRAVGFIMIPALYFILRLLQQILRSGGPYRTHMAAAVIVAALTLPIFMKSLGLGAREHILSAMIAVGAVDSTNAASIANARSALGIATAAPLYYSTRGTIRWLQKNTPSQARILTDRDDLILLKDHQIIGSRQATAVKFRATDEDAQAFFQATQAIKSRDTARVASVAMAYGAEFFIVPWRVEGAAYVDEFFSVVPVRKG